MRYFLILLLPQVICEKVKIQLPQYFTFTFGGWVGRSVWYLNAGGWTVGMIFTTGGWTVGMIFTTGGWTVGMIFDWRLVEGRRYACAKLVSGILPI